MSDQPPSTLFLERASYRRRRLMDALRLLPVVGVLLWMLPLLWPTEAGVGGDPDPVPMSRAVLYVFGVWLALICAAFAMWRGLWRADAPLEDAPGQDLP